VQSVVTAAQSLFSPAPLEQHSHGTHAAAHVCVVTLGPVYVPQQPAGLAAGQPGAPTPLQGGQQAPAPHAPLPLPAPAAPSGAFLRGALREVGLQGYAAQHRVQLVTNPHVVCSFRQSVVL
jgi:hypothetical protein